MKDYSLCEDGNSDYIVELIHNDTNNTYIVIFADGTKFKNIAYNEANLDKVKKIQERQANEGVRDLSIFKLRKTRSGLISALCGIGAGTIAGSVSGFYDIFNSHPVLTIAGVGIVSVLGAIPAYSTFKKNKDIVTEIEKVKYRDDHRKTLDNFKKYPNALSGISSRTAARLNLENDPFSILNIDGFSEEDLRMIVDNIKREEQYKFEYPDLTKKKQKNN